METAASCPCATAVMMFSARRPRRHRRTPGAGWTGRCGVSTGRPQRSKAMPCRPRSTETHFPGRRRSAPRRQGTRTSGSPVGTRLRRPFGVVFGLHDLGHGPVSWPPRARKPGARGSSGSGCPRAAHPLFPGRAFISSKPLRTMTLTSVPPRRRAERQQSMAGVAAAEHDDARRDASMWPNDTEASQSMPIWMLPLMSRWPGISRSRPRAPLPTNTAS